MIRDPGGHVSPGQPPFVSRPLILIVFAIFCYYLCQSKQLVAIAYPITNTNTTTAAAATAINLNPGASGNSYNYSQSMNDNVNCSITYYDENLQPLAQLNGTNTPNMQPQTTTSVNFSVKNNNITHANLSIGIECQFITAEQLLDQFSRLRPAGLKIISLVVKDSNLTALSNLPQGMNELRKLVISNTSIDLEVLKEGSESLCQLTTLEITNEKISNIPQNFFQEMSSLKELRLENDEIASLDSDAFHNLDDSLELLDLRRNRFNRFPMAVKNLAQLAVLDLSDNDIVIDTLENDLPNKLELMLNLRELAMNRINCTCEFSSSPYFEWITRTYISGVRCFAPEKLKFQEIIVFERDEFCARPNHINYGNTNEQFLSSHQYRLLLIVCQLAAIYLPIIGSYS